MKSNLCNMPVFSSLTSPCLTSLPLTKMVNGVRPLRLALLAAQTSAVSDRTGAQMLPQGPDGPFLDHNATPYRP